MNNDARINTSLPAHPKTKKLLRALGAEGGWFLIRLLLWAAVNRSDGDLAGLTDDDIELAIDWTGDTGEFVAALATVGFLDGIDGHRCIHDWSEHNPWAAGAAERSAKARWNAIKRHHGEAAADREVPEYRCGAALDAGSMQVGDDQQQTSNAPYPSPSPSPYPSPSPSPKSESPKGDLPPATVVAVGKRGAKGDEASNCPHEDIIDIYHEVLPELRRVRDWTPERSRLLRTRWRENKVRQDLGWWRRLFEYVRTSDFLMGRVAGRGDDTFQADLEWIIRPRNLVKIIEGKYENRAVA